MHSEVRARLHRGAATTTHWLPRWLAVLFPCSIVGSVLGQSVLVPPPGFQGAPNVPAMGNVSPTVGQPNAQASGQANGTANAAPNSEAATPIEGQSSETGTAAAAPAAPMETLMQWGALHLRARASYQFAYDTGIHSQPGKSTDTFTHTVSPGLTIFFGPHMSLDYSPSFRFFSQSDFHNTVDQAVSLSAGVGVGDWTLGLSQSFTLTDEPTVATGGQTEEKDYSASLNALYQFNDKISFDTSASVSLQFLNGTNTVFVFTNSTGGPVTVPLTQILTDSQNYSGSEWMDYKFDEKLSGGVGVTLSYSEQNSGFSSVSEEYRGRVSWRPGKKLTVAVNGGLEDQQFLNTGAGDLITPVFSATITYRLFEQTTLSLSADRAVDTSLFQNQVTESTRLGLGLQQRLFGKLQCSLGFGYSTVDYKDTTGKLTTARSDDSTSYSIGFNYPLWKRSSVSGFYQYTQNSSSASAFGYSSSQVGAVLSWAY